ncbi:thioredoxin family protein [Malaciobacter halophilus]|uniref:Thioredoxin family protein n=1 Tax=Malaciobacter halophilus TaxID=197482 RepID=A0A2N1J2B3_9BACT|nr:thioredoxin family protein [Malaciobacter halophilus]AXH09030.1 thioredoxin family protein (Thioredoxin_2 domain) [Malaciobacter halophilus]PKI80700.1 thioredoxin family protein [Malaciobacter halophilus]
MRKIILSILFVKLFLFASYNEGKLVFENKCSSCHLPFVQMQTLKKNFFEKSNKLLKLKAPTVNMLAYAIMHSPKKVGDPNDEEMREIEIEEYLKSYLVKPDRFNSICDEHILKYYDKKPSMKGELSDDDYVNLAIFFMQYDKYNKSKKAVKINSDFDEDEIILKAKQNEKLILVYATSKTCYYCKKMDKEVFSKNEVQKLLNKNYILLEVDMDKNKLPFNLTKYYKRVTPTFFVLDNNANYLKTYVGSWSKKDFIDILKENLK